MSPSDPEDDKVGDEKTRGDEADPDETTHDETRHDEGQPGHERPDLDDASVDAAFADIVAMWRAEPGPGDGPTATGATAAPGSTGEPTAGPAPGPGGGVDSAAIDEIFAARRRRIERDIDAAVDGPGGGHYVPPEPAPLPRLDLFALLAWAGALLGPVLIVIGAFTGGLIPRWVIAAAAAATIAGFVLLVSRLPRRGEADPEDNGAVV